MVQKLVIMEDLNKLSRKINQHCTRNDAVNEIPVNGLEPGKPRSCDADLTILGWYPCVVPLTGLNWNSYCWCTCIQRIQSAMYLLFL